MQHTHFIGLGVAGNFAGHLEQAGEAADFAKVKTEHASQPKAIFPFYVPNAQGDYAFLSTYPISSCEITFPNDADNLQIEPEVALRCRLEYAEGKVIRIIPTHFAAYNDCSIRRPNARKICEKKNWGAASKGLAQEWIPLDHLNVGGKLDRYRIACFHWREGVLSEYGVDSPVSGYSYFHQQLLDWILLKMNVQPDEGPMNNIAELLAQADYPETAVISIGATRYTEFGEKNFLKVGDRSIVVLYDGSRYHAEQIKQMAQSGQFAEDISALVQTVV